MRGWTWFVAFALGLGMAHPALAKKEKWVFRPAFTAVHFRVKHLLISTVRGSFTQVEGEIYLDNDDISQSSVTATVYIKSLFSGDAHRDRRLKGPDFFNMGTYPWATFNSKRVEQDADDNLLVTGDLTMHGVSKTVTFEVDGPTTAVKDPDGIPARSISAHTRLDRKDFGMVWNQALDGGGVEVGDEVIVDIDAELMPPPPPSVPSGPPAPASATTPGNTNPAGPPAAKPSSTAAPPRVEPLPPKE